MPTHIVIGHINPDTDSTCSAIAYAWFLTNHRHTPATAHVAGTLNKEALCALEQFQVEIPALLTSYPEGTPLTIVDTNNPAELLPNWEAATITEIIDHHKLIGGLKTSEPITVTLRPLGCTATLLYTLMEQEKVTVLPREIAGLLLSAILSDTLKFTSPTTTDTDRRVAKVLAEQAKVTIDDLATALFTAKSDLTGLSIQDILHSDSKVFTIGQKQVRVSVLETTSPEPAIALRSHIEQGMSELKKNETIDGALFFVVDILTSSATLLAPAGWERELASKAFQQAFTQDTLILPGVVSRKKQIIPALEQAA